MKNKSLLLIAILVFIGLQPASAAFSVKQTRHAETNKVVCVSNTSEVHTVTNASWFHTKMDQVRNLVQMPEKGTLGNLALIFGILSFIPFIGFAFGIPAIILGAKGIQKGQAHSRLGMIFGICTISVGLLLVILAIIFLAAM
jgi:hypothetical protein